MASDFAPRLRVIVHPPQMVAVRHKRKRAVKRQYFQAVSWQIKLANNFGTQQRNDIRTHLELKARKYFFRDCRTAQHVRALEHQDFLAGACEVSGIHKSIVATANNDDVVTV